MALAGLLLVQAWTCITVHNAVAAFAVATKRWRLSDFAEGYL